jgi:hypothetical protein
MHEKDDPYLQLMLLLEKGGPRMRELSHTNDNLHAQEAADLQ